MDAWLQLCYRVSRRDRIMTSPRGKFEGDKSTTGTPRFRRQHNWQFRWHECVPKANGHAFTAYLDFDNSILEDMLVHLLKLHSPTDAAGIQAWQKRHDAWVAGEISNGQNLYYHFVEVCDGRSLDELVEQLRGAHTIFPGVHDLRDLFTEHGVHMVGVTNAMRPFAEAMLSWHGIEMPFISNDLTVESDGTIWLEYLDDEDDMIRKDLRVLESVELGAIPISAIGDSMADRPMFDEVIAAGGFGIVVGTSSLEKWGRGEIAAGRLHHEQLVFVPDNHFDQTVLTAVRQRLSYRLQKLSV